MLTQGLKFYGIPTLLLQHIARLTQFNTAAPLHPLNSDIGNKSHLIFVLLIRFPYSSVIKHQILSSCHICTAGEDSQALIRDLSSMGQPVEGALDPILAYTAGAEIKQHSWLSSQLDWVAITFSAKLESSDT
ncbi:hypothetical protein SO802_013230 [Lithocarpus litseifolius]|uniref:Uncharacterized protein n=1 Tax=Lithocarpus litseifolius TaxID=425828 RepID=A0AAW2D5W8_9ROSI